MTVDIHPFSIPGPLLVSVKRFADARGFFSETYNASAFAAAGITPSFVQDNHSYSAMRGTVRGLHFQGPPNAQAKLVRVLYGSILDVFVDIRKRSTHYGEHGTAELTAKNGQQLLCRKALRMVSVRSSPTRKCCIKPAITTRLKPKAAFCGTIPRSAFPGQISRGASCRPRTRHLGFFRSSPVRSA